MQLITIVAPESSEQELADALRVAGAHGCSSFRARGRGTHGVRPTGWSGAGIDWHGPNVQIEAIVEADAIDRVLDALESRSEIYGPIVAWITDVRAWPGDKFAEPPGH